MERLFAKMDRLFEKYPFELGCTGTGWSLFVWGFVGLCALHYHSLAMRESMLLWPLTLFLLALFSITLVWMGTGGFQSFFVRIALFAVQAAAGFVLYAAMHLAYWDWAGFSF